MRRPLRLTALLSLYAVLVSPIARGEADTLYLGDGHDGALQVSMGTTQINVARPVLGSLRAGDLSVSVNDATGFAAGDLILLIQTLTDAADVAPTALRSIDLSGQRLGQVEFARLQSVTGNSLNLRTALTLGFGATGVQALRVPEYTTVDIALGARVVAPDWDGQSGGVLAFLATGAVKNEGTLSANAAGLRGGGSTESATGGCADLNEPSPRGSGKGENVLGQLGAAFSGFGNALNGGGGGNCLNAGGGGGGNGGEGGQGGFSDSVDGARDVGGRGGAAFRVSPLQALLLGGGGGAGHRDEPVASDGGRGGGIIFFRAQSLVGAGLVDASGQAGTDSLSSGYGAGGGGAGGTVRVQLVQASSCGQIRALGGNGGNATLVGSQVGPGGGGGAGNVLLQSPAPTSCPLLVFAGIAGTVEGGFYGAKPITSNDPGLPGQQTVLASSFQPGEAAGENSPDVLRLSITSGCSAASGLAAELLVLGLVLSLKRRRLG